MAKRQIGGLVVAIAVLIAMAASASARPIYVTDSASPERILAFDSRNHQAIGSPIVGGDEPEEIAITPDGRTAYVAIEEDRSVLAIDTRTNTPLGAPIQICARPIEIAIAPDGRTAYVLCRDARSVFMIDTQRNEVVGTPIPLGGDPTAIAISPDGTTAYVGRAEVGVLTIDLRTNTVTGEPIATGPSPAGIAFTPDGRAAYVPSSISNDVSVVDARTKAVTSIPTGTVPGKIAITPDGKTAYVSGGSRIDVIDTQRNEVVGSIATGGAPGDVAITPDGKTAYVAESVSNSVLAIDVRANALSGSSIPDISEAAGVAIVPNQPPVASFAAPAVARPGVPVPFDGSSSTDPDGSIASYDWAFGDGQGASAVGPGSRHAYAAPGRYEVKLSLTDDEGCSTSFVFTGQTAFCNGSAVAAQTRTVKVAYPGVRVKCPKRAGPACAFALQAVTKRRGGKAQSAIARRTLKRGRSAIVSLKPKPAFRRKLARAKKVLLKVTVKTGDKRRTSYRTLKIVQ